jgi:hypothetical protein
MARHAEEWVEWVLRQGVGCVVLDSLKDVAAELVKDDVGSAVNHAVQLLLVEGVEVVILAHPRKNYEGRMRLDHVYGSYMITAGSGSVLALEGDPKAAQRTLRNLKPAAGDVDMRLTLDFETGEYVEAQPEVDVFEMLLQRCRNGATAEQLRQTYYGKPRLTEAQTRKVRRQLGKLESSSRAVRREGAFTPGAGRQADVWLPTQRGS